MKSSIQIALRHLDAGDVEAAKLTLHNAIAEQGVFRLIYRSRSRVNDAGLEDILNHARAHNTVAGISGVLFEVDGVFLQVLEGDEEVVRDTFRRIEKDPRHCHIVPLIATKQDKRLFGGWSMASTKLNKATYDDFVGRVYRGSNDVEVLLQAFLQEGKFR